MNKKVIRVESESVPMSPARRRLLVLSVTLLLQGQCSGSALDFLRQIKNRIFIPSDVPPPTQKPYPLCSGLDQVGNNTVCISQNQNVTDISNNITSGIPIIHVGLNSTANEYFENELLNDTNAAQSVNKGFTTTVEGQSEMETSKTVVNNIFGDSVTLPHDKDKFNHILQNDINSQYNDSSTGIDGLYITETVDVDGKPNVIEKMSANYSLLQGEYFNQIYGSTDNLSYIDAFTPTVKLEENVEAVDSENSLDGKQKHRFFTPDFKNRFDNFEEQIKLHNTNQSNEKSNDKFSIIKNNTDIINETDVLNFHDRELQTSEFKESIPINKDDFYKLKLIKPKDNLSKPLQMNPSSLEFSLSSQTESAIAITNEASSEFRADALTEQNSSYGTWSTNAPNAELFIRTLLNTSSFQNTISNSLSFENTNSSVHVNKTRLNETSSIYIEDISQRGAENKTKLTIDANENLETITDIESEALNFDKFQQNDTEFLLTQENVSWIKKSATETNFTDYYALTSSNKKSDKPPLGKEYDSVLNKIKDTDDEIDVLAKDSLKISSKKQFQNKTIIFFQNSTSRNVNYTSMEASNTTCCQQNQQCSNNTDCCENYKYVCVPPTEPNLT